MPGIRPIKTASRQTTLEIMQDKLTGHLVNVEKVIEQLSQSNVDDKPAAKKLLTVAKKIQKGLASATV